MILVDVNVCMDVFCGREPHVIASSLLIDRIYQGRLSACLAAHDLTTIHYLLTRYKNQAEARETIDWALQTFSIAPVGAEELHRACAMNLPDFEDAVAAAAAESAGCTAIITRNVRDFQGSPIPAMHPEELVIDEIHESFVRGYAEPLATG